MLWWWQKCSSTKPEDTSKKEGVVDNVGDKVSCRDQNAAGLILLLLLLSTIISIAKGMPNWKLKVCCLYLCIDLPPCVTIMKVLDIDTLKLSPKIRSKFLKSKRPKLTITHLLLTPSLRDIGSRGRYKKRNKCRSVSFLQSWVLRGESCWRPVSQQKTILERGPRIPGLRYNGDWWGERVFCVTTMENYGSIAFY